MWQGIFLQSELSCRFPYGVRIPPCAVACTYICTHVKNPVVHGRVRWIMETLKHLARTVGWVVRLCRSWLFRESNPNSPWKESQWANTVINKNMLQRKARITESIAEVSSVSVQFNPLTDWVDGRTRGMFKQRSSSSLFLCRRPL